MSQPEVLVSQNGALGRLTLNRPQAIGALTLGMCQEMIRALRAWRSDPAITAVMIDHAGERGFCAGGDIRALAESGAVGGEAARLFFHTEYRLDHLISVYEKPIIAIMDGIVMGGGVGISLPARHRVATERTRFAMPETGIGLFPDVGGGWFLPRLPGRIGLWIALVGARLGPADCKWLDLATDVVSSADVPALKAALAERPDDAASIIAGFAHDPGAPPIEAARSDIDRLFFGPSVEAIVAALEADGSPWAREQRETLAGKSPSSLKVSFRQLVAEPRPRDLAEELVVEYRLGARIVVSHDFIEGVRALIVDKDNKPVWRPASLAEVGDDLLDQIFAPLPDGGEWTPAP